MDCVKYIELGLDAHDTCDVHIMKLNVPNLNPSQGHLNSYYEWIIFY